MRYRQALRDHDLNAAADSGTARLLMLGRGSSDSAATEEMHEFARRRVAMTPVGAYSVGFLAMASPTVSESAAQLVKDSPRLVVVQPHFLFGGQLLDRIRKTVSQLADSYPGSRWVLARPLGPDPLLADAIVSRIVGVQPSAENTR